MNHPPEDNVILYTVQKPGHDITQRHEPPEDYANTYWEIIDYLKWDYWVWTFPELEDFDNEWLVMEKMTCQDLWVLSVPASEIKWCALEQYCNASERRAAGRPTSSIFYPDQENIRALGDIPQGLVRRPIRPEWVIKVVPARDMLSGRVIA